MSVSVELQKHGNIALLEINAPPVNSLGYDLRSELQSKFQQQVADDSVEAIVITGGGRFFCAGADVTEFDSGLALKDPTIPAVFDVIDASPKPVIAAVNGAALGGGLELALACDYRFVSTKAQLGVPEVKLGIIPGAGGTQRLPRVIDLETAFNMAFSGKPVKAAQAGQLGLADEVSDAEAFQTAAVAYAQKLVAEGAPAKNCADISVDTSRLAEGFFDGKRKGLVPERNLAQLAVIGAFEAASQLPLKQGLTREWALFMECHGNPQSRAFQHLFFAERQATRIPGINPKQVASREIKKVAVIGAGLMGGGIAMNFASAGIPVTMLELKQEALERGLGVIKKNYDRTAAKGRISQQQADACNALISGTLSYDDLGDADLVIEAVFESMEVKKAVFGKLDEVCKPGAILASNTSTLDLDEIASFTSRPQDVIGLHFFSPANIMRLLEIVRGEKTSDEVLVTALNLAKTIRKQPVVVGVCYGFVGNRMVAPYSREAFRMLLEGASPEQVDGSLVEYGMAMGVVSMADMAGLDVGCAAALANQNEWAEDTSYQALQFKLKELGRLGQKTGRGVYIYEGRDKINDPETIELAVQIAADNGIERREIGKDEIVERCIFSLINEGARILEEGIAIRSSDIDLIYTNGYGFPAFRGGPMQYADEIGLDTIVAAMDKYRQQLGAYGEMWFKPAPLLAKLASEGKKFSEYVAG